MLLLKLALLTPWLFAQPPAATSDRDQLVKLAKVSVEGSRLELRSVEMLMALRPGQQINEAVLRKAIQRMLDSGLIKNVDYNYESVGLTQSVALELKIADELPLLPAQIEIPDVDAEDVWAYMQAIDPLFTRELPRTQRAIEFYERYIERYLTSIRRQQHVATVITADPKGQASGIVFVPATLLGTPQFKKK